MFPYNAQATPPTSTTTTTTVPATSTTLDTAECSSGATLEVIERCHFVLSDQANAWIVTALWMVVALLAAHLILYTLRGR